MKENGSISIRNIYYMLSYAFRTLRSESFASVETEEFENIHDLFACILAVGLGKQLKQGLRREYMDSRQDLPTLRGKIDIAESVQLQIASKRELACEVDELSENNLVNQILKTASMALLRHGELKKSIRTDLKKTIMFFSDIDEISPGAIRWSSLRFDRNNQNNRMLLGVCRLVLEGLLMSKTSGNNKLMSFLDDQSMSRLYEKFILEYFVKHCKQAKATASQIRWALDDGEGLLLPIMQSDIMLSRGDTFLIIDAKYYSKSMQSRDGFNSRTIHSNNLYQIFTYVKNKEAEFKRQSNTVSGMLLYAKTIEETQPQAVYQMSGNRISIRTLDLEQDFAKIAEQLDAIAQEHFPIVA